MKIINKLSYLLMAGALVFTACNGGDDGNNPPTPPDGGDLVLSADKESIRADGRDEVKFTVKYGDLDVTSAAVIKTGETTLSGGKFASSTGGEYVFTATYTDPETNELLTSNEVKVTASSLALSVEPATISVGGTTQAVFTVTYMDQDVTADAAITNVTLKDKMDKGDNEFSAPGYTGEFEFTAEYLNMVSNAVTVTVEAPVVNDLRLVADKGRVGVGEEVTFKVLNKGTDVTSEAKIKNTADGSYLSDAKFAAVAGTSKFVAEYGDAVSSEVSVGTGNFYKNVMVLKFTSVGCTYCASMAAAIEKAKSLLPNTLMEVAVHHPKMGSDPMIPSNISEFNAYFPHPMNGIPVTYYDMVDLHNQAVASSDVLGKVRPLSKKTDGVGIAATSTLNGTTATVDVNVTAVNPNTYYLAVALLENGIVHQQAGATGDYVHNYTYRKNASSTIFGDSLDAMTENQQISKQYTIELDPGYKADNCTIVCYVCYKDGEKWIVSNIVQLPLNGWVDYKFAEK